jgi:hypothetical protein
VGHFEIEAGIKTGKYLPVGTVIREGNSAKPKLRDRRFRQVSSRKL